MEQNDARKVRKMFISQRHQLLEISVLKIGLVSACRSGESYLRRGVVWCHVGGEGKDKRVYFP